MHWAAKCALSCTLLCTSPYETGTLCTAPPSFFSLLPSYTCCLWKQLLTQSCLQKCPLFLEQSSSSWGSSWGAWGCGEQGECSSLSVMISLVHTGSYEMVLVMTLHSHIGSLTQNVSHGRNLYLVSSVNLETHHFFVTKYRANATVSLFCVLGLKCSFFLT